MTKQSQDFIFTLIAVVVFAPQASAQLRKAPPPSVRNDPVILDIINDYRGFIPVEGEYILFRLYQSGRVEFEESQEHPGRGRYKKHMMYLQPGVVRDFITLAKQSDFLNAAQVYEAFESLEDTFSSMKIRFRQGGYDKQMVVNNYWSGERAKTYYPSSLIQIMKKVERVLRRYYAMKERG